SLPATLSAPELVGLPVLGHRTGALEPALGVSAAEFEQGADMDHEEDRHERGGHQPRAKQKYDARRKAGQDGLEALLADFTPHRPRGHRQEEGSAQYRSTPDLDQNRRGAVPQRLDQGW